MPELRSNLLSVIKLMERGLKVNFTDNEVKIRDEKQVVVTGRRFGNHFTIHMIPILRDTRHDCNNIYDIDENNNIINTGKFNGDIVSKWHRRLSHVNDKYVQRLIKEKLAIGINNEIKNVNCEFCKMCNLSRKPHKNVMYDQSEELLDLVHLDVCGLLPVNSIGGSRYILLIIDDYSGMYFTYFLKNKSDVFSTFQTFKERCENTLGRKIKRIRTDNGTEFNNKQFDELIRRDGIEHQKTVPYNPESNGKVKRGNRVLLERARTTLYESELPLSFWAEAIAYVTHTANLTPRKNMVKTPYEIWTRKYLILVI